MAVLMFLGSIDMKTREIITSLAILAISLFVGGLFFSAYIARSHRAAMVQSVELGLQRLYKIVSPQESGGTVKTPSLLRPEIISDALLSRSKGGLLLPSFVTPDKVLVPLETVRVSSDDPICVVEVPGGKLFQINANGQFKPITPTEIEAWAHRSLADCQRDQKVE